MDTLSIEIFSIETLSIETLSIETLSIEIFSIETLSIETLSIETFSIKTLSIETQCVAHFIVMLIVVVLSEVRLFLEALLAYKGVDDFHTRNKGQQTKPFMTSKTKEKWRIFRKMKDLFPIKENCRFRVL